MRVRLPRAIWIIGGIGIFIWLRLEDNAVWSAALIGLLVSALLTLKLIGLSRNPFVFILWGGVVGGGGAVIASILMLLKNGLHGHVFPDYPFGVIAEMLLRAPVWMGAGALAALAFLLFTNRALTDFRGAPH
jgi:hypothetical protein